MQFFGLLDFSSQLSIYSRMVYLELVSKNLSYDILATRLIAPNLNRVTQLPSAPPRFDTSVSDVVKS